MDMHVDALKQKLCVPEILSKCFLISDESEFDRRLIATILYDAGAREVIQASNGQDAMRVLMDGATDVDLVLLDIDMPRMDGLTLLEKIRTGGVDRRYQNVPLIMVTAMGEIQYREAARIRAASGFLIKPIVADALVAAVTAMLDS